MKETNKTKKIDWKKVMPYDRNECNLLLKLLNNKEIATALSYLVSFKKHNKLDVISKEHSIELSNKDITIAVILYAGFEGKEYEAIQNRKNFHIITVNESVLDMHEFKKLNVKYIDKMALLFTTLSLSKKPMLKELNYLKKLNF